jgi:hypothetical protein
MKKREKKKKEITKHHKDLLFVSPSFSPQNDLKKSPQIPSK